jgi:hypothetical protein
MKKVTKNSSSKAAHKKAVKDLDVKPAKSGGVRGGCVTNEMPVCPHPIRG